MTAEESKAVAFVGVLLCLALVARFMNRPKSITITGSTVDISALRAAGRTMREHPRKTKQPQLQIVPHDSQVLEPWIPAWRRAGGAVAASTDGLGDGPVDLNRANVKELENLPGVGPAMAKRIIGRRDSLGRFEKLEDLDAVKGIGPNLLAKLRPHVVIR